MQQGDILVAHPTYAHPFDEEAVVMLTEVGPKNVAGLRLNLIDDRPIEDMIMPEYIDLFPHKRVYLAGPHNPGALTMIHSGTWYSKNTMVINQEWSISSDELMLEKLHMGNTPDYFKLCLGWTTYSTKQLSNQLMSKQSPWLLHQNPSYEIITSHHESMYHSAISELSRKTVSHYFGHK